MWYVAWSPTMLTIGTLPFRGIVQVGQTVAEAGTEVEEHGGRAALDPRVAVGGTGGDALEQSEHAAHVGNRVERRDEVHLRRPGIHEAGVDAAGDERADERLGPVHDASSMSKILPGLRMPAGSNARLIRRMSTIFVGSSRARKYGFFVVPMPCSPEITPPSSMPAREQLEHQLLADVGVLLEHREVHVAVAGMAAARDPCAVRLADRREPSP